ncbi:extracellular solute-binding protein [Mesorhizobium sp. M2A.F.Ca.ET.037.01.1.1]|uniref:ABC transporter substrate-binding protein n=1 Tax=unclassified Mesorhizobium TaxID=325217 RepID=UPI000F74E2E0|nr:MULTISPECIES: ABC transporter substrate-binding protein [unclassified Mesorhizobium]RUV52876.1 extracellular solute-binding protein [Mesorhizobium sp. M7A.F.Ca.MR.228.00.0.0]RVC70749.1 extracellular solute-binding protein [Mesorhizobium sp. M00.F.Ca.ET.038.03.1.1]AZO36002.1 ABC transporter substrate-binding protein [Mesorhizobium sp. M2A.F.Ca.ET.046.03.2.1]AZO73061.1 ABC transporter substrate-binding protein [Mesorhizobium sp. M1D.F.Ca.ET.043.01.1.1]RUV17548.1 extracellular solute-binding p
MSFSIIINRRRFLQAASTALAAGALPSIASNKASAQTPGELRVLVYGGDTGKAMIEAYVKPFEAETGIKMTPITDQGDRASIEMMVAQNNVTVDVVTANQGSSFELSQKGLFEPIDYSIYRNEDLDGLADFAKQPFGVANVVYAFVMVYNTEKFPAGKLRPTTWAEFWDVNSFPGVRSLVSGQYGSEGPWEEALLADGVNPKDIYPMDLDRVFKSLDRIKPDIRKWWGTGSEIQQMMHDKAVDLVNAYDGRAGTLIKQGAPLEINRNQAKITWDYWQIVKGSPNAHAAQQFVAFTARADRQAAFSQLMPFGPSNLNAFKVLPEDIGRSLASHPDYLRSSVLIDSKWYAEKGSDGLTNTEKLVQRWNEWILL